MLLRFAPPLALMALIFFLSAQPDLDSGLGDWDTVLRKLAHMVEYGVLALLWWRALRTRSPLPPALIAITYGISDEFHQSFVAGRHGSPVDVLIDSAGVALAITAYRLVTARRGGGSSGARSPAGDGMPVASAKDAGRSNSGALGATEDAG